MNSHCTTAPLHPPQAVLVLLHGFTVERSTDKPIKPQLEKPQKLKARGKYRKRNIAKLTGRILSRCWPQSELPHQHNTRQNQQQSNHHLAADVRTARQSR